jgi:uncharacterized membrane protein
MMSELVVLTFDDTGQAGAVFESLKQIERSGQLKLDDAAVIVKDESGKVHVKNQLDTGIKGGVLAGGVLGLLIAGLFFPLAGLVIGALGGALVGKSLNYGVDPKFVKEVTESLKPGTSALFVIGSGNPTAVRAALQPFQGTVFQTTLPPEAVETLERALKDKK